MFYSYGLSSSNSFSNTITKHVDIKVIVFGGKWHEMDITCRWYTLGL